MRRGLQRKIINTHVIDTEPLDLSLCIVLDAKQEIEQTAQYGSYSLNTKEDWIGILNHMLKEQYDMGFMDGFLKNKAYLDFLTK